MALTKIKGAGINISTAEKLYFDGGGTTYIQESADGVLDFYADNVKMLELLEGGTDYVWVPVDATKFAIGAGKDLNIYTSSDDAIIENITSDKDIIFKGNDGGSTITALTLDISAAGAATFNDKIIATELDISGNMDIDGTSNLDVVDIDGAVDMASTLTVAGVVDVAEYIKHTGDADTSIRFSANDAIEITAGNVKMMRFLEDDSQDMVVINEDSADIDFRVESNNNANMLFVDGGNDRVGIGTNSPQRPLHINSGGAGDTCYMQFTQDGTGAASGDGLLIGINANEQVIIYNQETTDLIFYTNQQERMRIDSSGGVGIGDTSPDAVLDVVSGTNGFVQILQNTHGSSPYGLAINHDHDADNNTRKFLNCDGGGTNRCIIWADGDVNNDDNAYGSISDVRIKQGIRDANSQWDDIKAIKVRNFKKNSDVIQYKEKAWEQIGVIAQELEESGMDKLVREHPADESEIATNEDINEGDMVKSVQYSIIYMKAIKALQEAMAKIETLESKVTALENA